MALDLILEWLFTFVRMHDALALTETEDAFRGFYLLAQKKRRKKNHRKDQILLLFSTALCGNEADKISQTCFRKTSDDDAEIYSRCYLLSSKPLYKNALT